MEPPQFKSTPRAALGGRANGDIWPVSTARRARSQLRKRGRRIALRSRLAPRPARSTALGGRRRRWTRGIFIRPFSGAILGADVLLVWRGPAFVGPCLPRAVLVTRGGPLAAFLGSGGAFWRRSVDIGPRFAIPLPTGPRLIAVAMLVVDLATLATLAAAAHLVTQPKSCDDA